jgi:hypothetical protein
MTLSNEDRWRETADATTQMQYPDEYWCIADDGWAQYWPSGPSAAKSTSPIRAERIALEKSTAQVRRAKSSCRHRARLSLVRPYFGSLSPAPCPSGASFLRARAGPTVHEKIFQDIVAINARNEWIVGVSERGQPCIALGTRDIQNRLGGLLSSESGRT